MNRILLALTILGAGAAGFHTAHRSTTQLSHEAQTVREAWLTQTQLVAAAQSDQAGLTEHIRELKQTLAQPPTVAESALWSALQTNRADRFPPELRERIFEELGFNWRSSPDFIVVSKQTVRDISMRSIHRGKLTDLAATVLAITTEERGQIEAALQRVQAEFKDWVLAHVERGEPKDDVVAQYTLPNDQAMLQSISNNFAAGLLDTLGRERTEVILPSARYWMNSDMGLGGSQPTRIIIKRDLAGNERRLKVEIWYPGGGPNTGDLAQHLRSFPPALRPLFPNGWADVAQREGFELPEEPQKK